MSRRTVFAAAMLAAFCMLPLFVRAQTQDRTQVAAEIESLREQIKAREALLLAISSEDREAFAEFLAQPRTGIVRLLPREKWDGKLSMRGGGAYYSFTRLVHEYGFGSDISLEQNYFGVGFAGASFGFLVNLGNVPLESVTLSTDGVRYLAAFSAPNAEPGARVEQRRSSMGFEAEDWTYKSRLPVFTKQTYVVRSVDYGTSDVLVAFRVVRKDVDGSVILVWKILKKFSKPELERAPTTAVATEGS
jgi:hypothetical protein